MVQMAATREGAASLIHDLGNFIQIASSAVNILARNPRLRDTDLEPVLVGAQKSLNAASSLVRQNMALRHLASGDESVDVVSCLAEVEALIAVSWDPKFRLHMRVAEDLPELRCDPAALQNAILNLLLNARDAMPDGGDILLGAIQNETNLEIAVADNGVGMSAETALRAFDPFFTTKADGQGGLGLPSIERFARAAGGRVRVASELGVGTIVTLQLPGSSAQ